MARDPERDAPILMSDALSRNVPKDHRGRRDHGNHREYDQPNARSPNLSSALDMKRVDVNVTCEQVRAPTL
jgi:hypothetical protein